MNRKLLALAVGAALSLPLAAQAAPTVYGQLNLSVDMVNLESVDGDPAPGIQATDNWQVNSNASRLGVMGEEALGNGLSAVYKIEGVVDGAGDIGYDWDSRDRYLGLKGSFGTFKLGNFDSPLKSSQGMVDQFNDMRYGDMGVFIAGENRMSNLIGYESPKIADAITAKVVIQPGETNADSGPAEAISASVAYEAGGLYAALAYDSKVSSGSFSPANARDTLRLTGTFTAGDMQLGALLQTSQVSDETPLTKDDQDALLVSAAFNIGLNTIKGQVVYTTDDFGLANDQSEWVIEAGLDHNFTKMTKAYGQLGYAQTSNLGGSTVDANDTVFSIGMLTKF